MNIRDLENISIPNEMLKHDLGIGIIPIYTLNNGRSVLVMAEYHNKGALSPTIGARFRKKEDLYTHLKNAFARKCLGFMNIHDEGKLKENTYYSINTKQNLARITFVQHVNVDLSEEAFQQQYIEPMHREALRQRSVSEFFWKLDETQKGSRFKFKSNEEQVEFAKKALREIAAAKFKLDANIINQLNALTTPNATWEEKSSPLEFYQKNGGRKYSELTAFYLMPLVELEKQFILAEIKKDPEKPTIFMKHANQPKEERWKKLFIFEEEVNLLADIVQNHSSKNSAPSLLFAPTPWKNLPSPWSIEMMNVNQLEKVNKKSEKSVSINM